ncbi:MAG: DUF4118 domain-containing protein, partial [Gammaproteobacteria bacterium]|nr:DUF4118 domain-containing protein [Gammaproteobacteria bacterium]
MGEDENANLPTQTFLTAKTEYKPYWLTFITIILAAGLGWLFSPWITPINVLFLLLLPAVSAGVLWGTRVAIFASIVAIGIADFFFMPPIFSFAIANLNYLSNFFFFSFVVIATSWIGRLIRLRVAGARYRERFVYALY